MDSAPLATAESYSSIRRDETEDSADDEKEYDFVGNEIESDRIPYIAIYDDKDEVRKRGYFIPAYPVVASIIRVEKSRGRVAKLTNPYVYTIDLKHGPYHWTVKRRYADFQRLNNSLKLYRATALILSPFQRGLEESLLTYSDGEHLVEISDGISSTVQERSTSQKISAVEMENRSKKPAGPAASIIIEKAPLLPQNLATPGQTDDRKIGRSIRLASLQLTPVAKTAAEDSARRRSLPARVASGHPGSKVTEKTFSKATRRQMLDRDLPDFPTIPDTFVGESKLEERKMALEHYLRAVLKVKAYRDHSETARFLEVSRLSFVRNLGPKDKEGIVERRPNSCLWLKKDVRKCCLAYCMNWKDAWLVVKDSFVALLDPRKELVHDVMLFDKDFDIYTQTEYPGDRRDAGRNSLFVTNGDRYFMLKCDGAEEAIEWKREIENMTMTRGSVWLDEHRFGSSYPIRDDFAQWLVDGRSYMEHAANILELAKEDIFIADFTMNVHIHLKRPIVGDRWRLDSMLKRKAEEGVRVFILLYKEITRLMPGIGSYETEEYLTSLSPNIKVLRHPDIFSNVVLLWTHHEKLIVVDQKIAFVGGLDLCYGRWDDHSHKLVDLGTDKLKPVVSPAEIESEQNEIASRLKRHYDQQNSPIPGRKLDDQSVQKVLKDEALSVADVMDMKYARVKSKQSRARKVEEPVRFDKSGLLWPGKDYQNSLLKDLVEPEKAFEDIVDRTVVPRLAWHDIGCVVYGSAARDIARHFIQRWNAAKAAIGHKNIALPFLLPKSYENVQVPEIFQQMSLPCKAQVLRSSDTWSTGHKGTEDSIYQAYLKLIEEAEHYIYIENQFFISSNAGPQVTNKISEFIFTRILRAHQNKETFRVYVVMPLLPGYMKTSGAMQMELHFTYMTISKGKTSLLKKLKEAIGDPSPYISFCSLRTHGELLGRLVTELIYVHSKIVIVDDRKCLIGSANIDDRSLLGGRDSELAVLIEDTTFSSSAINGQPFESGVFAGSLRKQLFHEYLGSMENSGFDLSDPISADFYNFWTETAEKNSEIYEKVFECAPCDDLKTLEQWAQKEQKNTPLAETDKDEALKLLQGVRGHLVSFSTEFLSESDLLSEKAVIEAWMPSYIFT